MPARRPSAVLGTVVSERGGRVKDGGKEKETFACSFSGCGQAYSRMEYLKRHQRKHQDVRPFQCKDCSKAFARSDVLLRHRRRCHPTPPPPDRSSHSPPPPHRGYPSMPISSSRTDTLETSPRQRSHKHPRQDSGSSQGVQHGSHRRPEEEDSNDEEGYAESSRYARHNGMGNGGVYGMGNYYDEDNQVESTTYTPHLLPMFQQSQPYNNNNNAHDENHLEDASVLLSLSYPGGHPTEGENPTVQGQRVVPDWEAGQTINMMMDAANQSTERDRSVSTASGPPGISTPGDAAALSESMENFLGAMSWLGGMKEGSTPGDNANEWPISLPNASPKPLSPFPLSALFSPSAFGMIDFPNVPPNEDESNQAVQSIIEQLAMYDVPETRINPNPERPLLRLAHSEMTIRAGAEAVRGRFHLPVERFAGCYQIPHWNLPPLKTLSLMARRTFDTILNHFSFVHAPTFRIVDTAACLAFAICTVGGIRPSKPKWEWEYEQLMQGPPPVNKSDPKRMDGAVQPERSWESMYKANYENPGDNEDEEIQNANKWANGTIVRNDKQNMLVKSFSLAQGVLMTEYNVALLQALVLYNAPYFLSEDENERSLAGMFLGTIVNISRQIGFFNHELGHFDADIQYPQEPYSPNDLDLSWRRWIQFETRRRTAYLLHHLDTVSALESNVPCILTVCEVSNIPLPAPDTLWKAETAEDWLRAVKKYRPMTLDEAMRRMFFLPTFGAFDALHEQADTKFYNLLNESALGPFARVAMMLCLLRGIIDVGEGKRDHGDWRDLTDLWVSCSWLKPSTKMLSSNGEDLGPLTQEGLRGRFTLSLERWRQGWDFDSLCPSPAASFVNSLPAEIDGGGAGDHPKRCKENFCEEALPFYWLAQALLNILDSSPPHEPGWNVFSAGNAGGGIRYGEMLKSARTFTRTGEGVVVGGV